GRYRRMTLGTVVVFIVVLGVLIFAHELGHFLVAKWCRVGVLKFSLGFGPKLFGFRRGETEYLLSAVPLGGYVKMAGEDPQEVVTDAAGRALDSEGRPLDLSRSFAHKPVWARACIIVAGPGANVFLALLLAWLTFTALGIPDFRPVVEVTDPSGPAARAGLTTGDEVQAVAGTPIWTWGELTEALQRAPAGPVTLRIARDGVERSVEVQPEEREVEPIPGMVQRIRDIGVAPFVPPVIGEIIPGYPAAETELKMGDRIVAVNGLAVRSWNELRSYIGAHPREPLTLTVERGGRREEVSITPRLEVQTDATGKTVEEGKIGIGPREPYIFVRTDPFRAIGQAVAWTAKNTALVGRVLAKMVTGDISTRTIGGPILIAQLTGQAAQQGLHYLILLTALISVNLAVLNLLPIPILDGGHLLFMAIEAVWGQPLSARKREIAQRVGLALLVAIMILAFSNDILRLLGGEWP
ncbi:MAG: RIP metalloprotease RseP, partial [Gemmatimonadota bacterium]